MYATLLQKVKKNVVGLKFEIADIMTSIMALISALNPSFITTHGLVKKMVTGNS